MAAPSKLSTRRRSRFLELVRLGLTIDEASGAVHVSRQAIHWRVKHDPAFGAALDAVRIRPDPAPALPAEWDWQDAARRLEAAAPQRWAPLPWDVD